MDPDKCSSANTDRLPVFLAILRIEPGLVVREDRASSGKRRAFFDCDEFRVEIVDYYKVADLHISSDLHTTRAVKGHTQG